ncbi:hypothetical protein RSOLAG22IIIB_09397 [Rhizoctonia solani]|uniref:Uncharacterized protein n=1 Tax=Rhizoctonia solani TaxID=456999 RepID=A0A0K6FY28_9AGAM|nr:hypothetical protein RSOLAG22IIIB_09397 [Rhizoctonia solani]
MDFAASHNYWGVPRDDPTAKFIVIKPDELQQSPELFVSNNPEDGYDLTFQSLAEFEVWRQQEEEMHTIEFVRGDSHGSRSNPPRFKEHVKLVCARHSRRGRKQYVKKYPERVRKLPNRKIYGVGCPASICYKTYVDTSIVRVMYRREHSHPTGADNLVFTKRGRRILAQRNSSTPRALITPSPSISSGEFSSPNAPSCGFPPSPHTSHSDVASSQELEYSISPVYSTRSEEMGFDHAHAEFREPPSNHQLHEAQASYLPEYDGQAPICQPALHEYNSAPVFSPPLDLPAAHTTYDRWDRLAALFRSIHENALSFDQPQEPPEVLEEAVIQLYLGINLMEAPANFRQGLASSGMMERSPTEVARVNHNWGLVHPVPLRNMCFTTPELFKEAFPAPMTPTEPRFR